jgi:DNA-binding response OmpR family regulator
MADRSVPRNHTNQLEIRELPRGTREAPLLRLAGDEQYLAAVPTKMRDLFYTRLVELQQRGREARTDCKYVAFAGWELDLLERHLIAPGGGVVHLPGLEYSLLRAFIGRPRQPLSRSELALLSIRLGQPYLSIRTVDSYVCRLRRRLSAGGGALLISTVRKFGYSFDADVVSLRA